MIQRIGLFAAYATAFLQPWNGWLIAGVRPGDLLLFVALACLVATRLGEGLPHLPVWVVQLGVVIIVVAIVHVLAPPDPHFLQHRIVIDAGGKARVETQASGFVAFKFVVAIVVLPLVFTLATMCEVRAIRRMTIAFTTGVAASALVAFTDGQGFTSLARLLTGRGGEQAREAGFANHPNFLAAGCVLALPLAIWLVATATPRLRWLGAASLVAIVLGVFATGSRGAAVCVPIGIVAGCLIIPRVRAFLPIIVVGAAATVLGITVAFPEFGNTILTATRLVNGLGSGSDQARTIVGNQALSDVAHYPITGIGLQVVTEAQNVYLQILASGGLLLMGAMIVYTLSSMVVAAQLMPAYLLAGGLLASTVAKVAYDVVGADLSDRFYYVPIAITVAFAWAARQRPEELFEAMSFERRAEDDSGAFVPVPQGNA